MENKYTLAKKEKQKYFDAILKSPSKKKIIVAGPGTGKTDLFKKVIKDKSNSLTLTFVNTLVEDLSLELCGLSEVRTLHSFARSILSSLTKNEIKIFPKLNLIIKEDAKTLLAKDIDFDNIFYNRKDKDENIDFYKKRKKYYDNYYGYSDIIFAVTKYLEKNENKIPSYDQILVDEFQDFNKLEVSLIDLLSKKNYILLSGDDDQALYDFKSASTQYIRHKYGNQDSGFTPFTLPYCLRCTNVIVGAVNDIISTAQSKKLLIGRIQKEYLYFDDEKKDKISSQNPKIIYVQSYANQIPWRIEQQINLIAKENRTKFSVLIISPTKTQTNIITKTLTNKGFNNIETVDKKADKEITLLDGLKLLLENNKDSLGWRIISKFFLSNKDFKSILEKSNKENGEKIINLLDKNIKLKVIQILKILRAIKKNENIEETDFIEVLNTMKINPLKHASNYLKKEINSSSKKIGNPGIRKIPIKITTIQGSKGLSADYVFITYFDDQYFIKNKVNISDQDICNFLVSLTRAKKRVVLISSNPNREQTFLKWINPNRIDKLS